MRERSLEIELLALTDALGGGETKHAAVCDFSLAEWQGWYHRVEEHGLAPGLYRLLERPRWSGLPAEQRAECRARYLEQTARTLGARRQCTEIRECLENASIPVLPLKALAFSGTLYDDPGLRQFGDLDLLIPEEAAGEAEARLHALGYRPLAAFTSREEAALHARFAHLCPLARPGGLPVELHTHLLKDRGDDRMAVRDTWDHAGIDAAGTRRMRPEHEFVYAAAHYAGHLHLGGARLKWAADLLRMARYEEALDWEPVRGTAERWRLTPYLAPVMHALRDHWNLPVGKWPSAGGVLGSEQLTASPQHSASRLAPSALARLRQVRELPGWGRRARYFWHLAFPEAEHLRFRYSLPAGAPVTGVRLLHPLRQASRFVRGWVGSHKEGSAR